MLDRQLYTEYVLMAWEDSHPDGLSLLAEPGYYVKGELSGRIAARRRSGEPYQALPRDEEKYLSVCLPRGSAAEMISEAAGLTAALAKDVAALRFAFPFRTPQQRDDFEAAIAATRRQLFRLDTAAERLGRLAMAAKADSDGISDRILDLTVLFEAGRMDALDSLAESLRDAEYEAQTEPPEPQELFGDEYRRLTEPLAEIDGIRRELVLRLDECLDFTDLCSSLSLAMSESARDVFPAALGRISEAAGLLGADTEYSFSDSVASFLAAAEGLSQRFSSELEKF